MELNDKFQYSMDKEKHNLMLSILQKQGLKLAPLTRKKIKRLFEVNTHININSELKERFLSYLNQQNKTIHQFMSELADLIIDSAEDDDFEETILNKE